MSFHAHDGVGHLYIWYLLFVYFPYSTVLSNVFVYFNN